MPKPRCRGSTVDLPRRAADGDKGGLVYTGVPSQHPGQLLAHHDGRQHPSSNKEGTSRPSGNHTPEQLELQGSRAKDAIGCAHPGPVVAIDVAAAARGRLLQAQNARRREFQIESFRHAQAQPRAQGEVGIERVGSASSRGQRTGMRPDRTGAQPQLEHAFGQGLRAEHVLDGPPIERRGLRRRHLRDRWRDRERTNGRRGNRGWRRTCRLLGLGLVGLGFGLGSPVVHGIACQQESAAARPRGRLSNTPPRRRTAAPTASPTAPTTTSGSRSRRARGQSILMSQFPGV